MKKVQLKFDQGATDLYFDANPSLLSKLAKNDTTVYITDEHVFQAHPSLFKNRNVIVLKPGEQYKILSTVEEVVQQLIAMQTARGFTLVGVGGGVVTDIAGFIASVYMRGIRFGFVPTSLLAMVDASLGGKNGLDFGVFKNIIGVVQQPSFILYDPKLLKTLPEAEWRNGFAEIIKHAAIADAAMFTMLAKNNIKTYQRSKLKLSELIRRNVLIKSRIVKQDPFEKGSRRLLNFGHTLGHALENQYELSHGEAIAIGMAYAAVISEKHGKFRQAEKLISLLDRYGLPAFAVFDQDRVMKVLKMDKKRASAVMHYVMLERIGKGMVQSIPLKQLSDYLKNIQA